MMWLCLNNLVRISVKSLQARKASVVRGDLDFIDRNNVKSSGGPNGHYTIVNTAVFSICLSEARPITSLKVMDALGALGSGARKTILIRLAHLATAPPLGYQFGDLLDRRNLHAFAGFADAGGVYPMRLCVALPVAVVLRAPASTGGNSKMGKGGLQCPDQGFPCAIDGGGVL